MRTFIFISLLSFSLTSKANLIFDCLPLEKENKLFQQVMLFEAKGNYDVKLSVMPFNRLATAEIIKETESIESLDLELAAPKDRKLVVSFKEASENDPAKATVTFSNVQTGEEVVETLECH